MNHGLFISIHRTLARVAGVTAPQNLAIPPPPRHLTATSRRHSASSSQFNQWVSSRVGIERRGNSITKDHLTCSLSPFSLPITLPLRLSTGGRVIMELIISLCFVWIYELKCSLKEIKRLKEREEEN
ncbi:hypothetical protein E2C01_095827 [Portunus trituberculatus]|uniref:Uncharacterized protein n=1 Tax=Portunus trituberculatus TaxID=210409 RepID=A0A5B7JU20_PORTR|nr:hypothetical protein [Portunus trituberculatus]